MTTWQRYQVFSVFMQVFGLYLDPAEIRLQLAGLHIVMKLIMQAAHESTLSIIFTLDLLLSLNIDPLPSYYLTW